MALPVAIQLYTLRHEMAADFRGTLEKVREMGYDGVEFAGLFDRDPKEVKKMCEEIGLNPISAHVPYQSFLNDAKATVAVYRDLGVSYVAIPYLPEEFRPWREKFYEVINNLPAIGKALKAAGIGMLYHNHDFEFVKKDGQYGLDYIYEKVPADLLQTELDLCWVNVGGEDPADYVRKYAGRCPLVHLKDFYGQKEENMYELIGQESRALNHVSHFEYRPVGYGLQDFPKIMPAVVESGAKWTVVEMDSPSMGLSPLECARKSIEYLRSIGY